MFRKKTNESQYDDVKLTSNQSIAWRRAVYILFILAFAIITPLIIAYTQGYRYNFKRGKVQKTGIFVVSSIPKKADVYLNGQIAPDQTPARLEKLLPADYEIRLAKAGYHDWNKKLQIFENSTTFAEDVLLWKNELPIQLKEYDAIDWLASPENNRVVFLTNDRQIIDLDFVRQEFTELYQANSYDNIDLIGWSNTGKKIIAKVANKHLVINVEKPSQAPRVVGSKNYTDVKWDADNDNVIYGLNNSGLTKIDLFAKQETAVLNKKISDFIVLNDFIYYFSNGIIYRQKINDAETLEIIDGIKCADCRFVNKNTGRLILLDREAKNLFIVDPERKNKIIQKEAAAVSWLKNDTLLFYNNWEIWLYELNEKDPEMITRLGAKIENAVWHPNGRHIIFSSNNEIKIIELDNRELRNMISLFKGGELKYLAVNDKGDNLYFNAVLAGKEYVMDLTIQ